MEKQVEQVSQMLLDGMYIMHELLDEETRNKKQISEIKLAIAINNSLTTTAKTFIQSAILEKAIENSKKNNASLIYQYDEDE